MKIAILGGGFTGLSAAYYLSKKGHDITLFERDKILGGLAVGFKAEGWDWPLERAYHHLFASDTDILNLAKETEFTDIFFKAPQTNSLYRGDNNNYRTIPVDSPQDFLKFPLLSLLEKLRAAFFLAILKFGPFFPFYEKYTVNSFVRTFMGENMWKVFFAELFRKKFGKYAENVLASFLWARINKRTKKLGYVKNGFQTYIEHLEKTVSTQGVKIKKSTPIESLTKSEEKFSINNEIFDAVISTLPSPILAKVGERVLPADYLQRFKKLQYLSAVVIILETEKAILDQTYWLNVCVPEIPIMFIGQHTNFVDKNHYGGKHLAYAANYLEPTDPLLKLSDEEVATHYISNIEKVTGYTLNVSRYWIFRAPFAQPIFDKTFLENKPDFITPTKNFFVANLDMTYPYDRGTNFAVKLGKDVSELL